MKKNRENKRVKQIMWGFILLALFVPMAQQVFSVFKEIPLKGSYTNTEKPTFSAKDWFEGTYQTQAQDYLNEQFGFRASLIRLYNEWYYRLYNQARANDVIIGKEGYLYGDSYINAYLGTDYQGEGNNKEKVKKLAAIRDTLATKNIDIIVLLAPGKASFYPEYLPDEYVKEKNSITNHASLKAHLLDKKIHTLDFLTWFDKMKDTSQYPLFPKTGIHWSKYGEVLVADSLLKYIAQVRNTPMPWLYYFGFETSKTPRDTDDDIEKGMNIISRIPDLEMAYYFTQVHKDSTLDYPRISVIGDSYYWGIFALGIADIGFNKGDFWYYFNEKHHTNGNKTKMVGDIDSLSDELEENDVLIILSTDANLSTFGHGFIEKMYDVYYPSKK